MDKRIENENNQSKICGTQKEIKEDLAQLSSPCNTGKLPS